MQKQREHWSSEFGFVLAAAGSAIGLGTLWKFPYVTGENGGGLFVFIYAFCTLFVGVPLFIAELTLGRKAQRGAVGVFASLANNSAGWKTAGWLGVAAAFLIMTFYSVLAGWGMNYILMSLNQFYVGRTPDEIAHIFDVLSKSGDITLFWQAVFISIAVALVYPGIRHGIEYWNRIMTTTLLILMVAMGIYCVTLDGYAEAFKFVFTPRSSGLKASGFLEALGLSFFTLSLGQGVMLTYGSYMRRQDDIPKTGLVIGTVIIVVASLCAMIIYPILFTFDQPPQQGVGLVFKALPLLFAKLPGALILSVGFFTLFVFTAITSAMPLIEVVAANLMDLFGWSRHRSVLLVGAGMFIFGIPCALSGTDWLFPNWELIYGKTFFATVDELVSNWIIPSCGLMTVLFAGWYVDKSILKEEFESDSVMKWLFRPWLFFLRWVSPLAIILIFLQMTGIINIDHLIA